MIIACKMSASTEATLGEGSYKKGCERCENTLWFVLDAVPPKQKEMRAQIAVHH